MAASKYFENLLDGNMQNTTKTGELDDEVFIDRDEKLFGYVLQYLRTGHVFIESQKC
jgi:hypothetical protein